MNRLLGLLPARVRRIGKLGLGVITTWPRPPIQVLTYNEIETTIRHLPAAPIPKVIHQIWVGPQRPPLQTMASCRHANPGWLYVLWTDDNLPPLRNRVVFDAFGTAYHGKADVLRYELLYRFGGVYVDADQLCLRSFDDLMGPDDSFFAGYQNFGNPDLDDERRRTTLVANAVLGVSPRHPIMERVIRDIEKSPADARRRTPWMSVGPGALTRAIEETPARAVIHPFHEFYPYHFIEKIPASAADMLKAIHYESHSVSLWGTTLGGYGRLRRFPRLKPGGGPGRRTVPAEFIDRYPKLAATVYHS